MGTKEKLFEIALNLFSEKGVNGTSIRMITSEAGVSVASFYNHFKSKDELLQQMYDYYVNQYIAGDANQSPEELLTALGPLKLIGFIGESIAQSMNNEKIVRLSRIIMMDQYINETARKITMKDKKLVVDSMEQLFIQMKNQNMIDVKDPSLIGKIIGYAYLGFASDNANHSIIDGEDPQPMIAAQSEMIADYIKSILVEK